MNPTNITIILAAVGILAIVITIYRRLKTVVVRIKLRRESIAKIDTLEGYIHNNFISVGKIHKKINKVESLVGGVKVLADNFNRDMDKYNENLNKDMAKRIKVFADRLKGLDDVQLIHAHSISKLEKNTPPKNMADVLKRFENIHKKQNEIYAERIETIERRQKQYDTSLFTQAKMIGDLQNRQRQYDISLFKQGKLISDLQVAQSKNLDRFQKVMDLENVKVK